MAPALLWRVAITEPAGRTVEVDTPSGWTLADWQAYAERYYRRRDPETAAKAHLSCRLTGEG